MQNVSGNSLPLILTHHEKKFPKSKYSKQSVSLQLLASNKMSKIKMQVTKDCINYDAIEKIKNRVTK